MVNMINGNLEVTVNNPVNNIVNVNTTNPNNVTGSVNGVSFSGFQLPDLETNRVIVTVVGGNTLLQCPGYRRVEAKLNGGNDRFYGSQAGSVARGGVGQNLLVGGAGYNVLIGGSGTGACVLQTSSGAFLIAGEVDASWDYDSLRALLTAWIANPAGTDLTPLKNAITPSTSTQANQLSGCGAGQGPVAFFCRTNDLVMNFDASKGDVKILI
jgi:Ca2+-binding RTX toxin-like protein